MWDKGTAQDADQFECPISDCSVAIAIACFLSDPGFSFNVQPSSNANVRWFDVQVGNPDHREIRECCFDIAPVGWLEQLATNIQIFL